MTKIEDQFVEIAVPELFEQFGQPITYTPGDGSGTVSLTAILGSVKEIETINLDDRQYAATLEVTFSTDPSSAYGGVPNPVLHDALNDGSADWDVAEIVSRGGGLVTVRAARQPAAERAYDGFRARS